MLFVKSETPPLNCAALPNGNQNQENVKGGERKEGRFIGGGEH